MGCDVLPLGTTNMSHFIQLDCNLLLSSRMRKMSLCRMRNNFVLHPSSTVPRRRNRWTFATLDISVIDVGNHARRPELGQGQCCLFWRINSIHMRSCGLTHKLTRPAAGRRTRASVAQARGRRHDAGSA
nr:putative integron gene cassette protein [uncultured bacterium]